MARVVLSLERMIYGSITKKPIRAEADASSRIDQVTSLLGSDSLIGTCKSELLGNSHGQGVRN